MSNANYNGWTNYATWRVNLEIFDGADFEHRVDGEYLKDYTIDILEQTGSGLVLDYALAFLSDVNWYEIADSLNEDYEE